MRAQTIQALQVGISPTQAAATLTVVTVVQTWTIKCRYAPRQNDTKFEFPWVC